MPRLKTVELVVPQYLVGRPNAAGRWSFHFQVPARHRPEGWPGARRLPLDPALRTGLGDDVEWRAAIADAEQLYKQMAAEKARLRPVLEPHGTIHWIVARITDAEVNYAWDEHSAATRKNYLSDFRTLKDWAIELGHPHIAQVSRSQLGDLLKRFRAKPFKQKHLKSALAYIYKRAIADELVQATLIDKHLALAQQPKSEPIEWTAADVDAFCARAIARGQPSLAKAIRLKWWTGMRNTDLLALTCPKHVFRSQGQWMVDINTSKRGRPVITRLTADVAALHEAELAGAAKPGTEAGPRPFLVNEHTGGPWTERPWQHNVAEILGEIERGHLKPGWLRHTVMTTMDEAGISDAASAAVVGHSPSGHVRLKERHYRMRTKVLAEQGLSGLEAHRSAAQNKERKSDD